MTTKPLRFPTSGFKANELYEPGFLWYEGKPVAFVNDHFAVQLLLPAELLERHPYYSASFNGFVEISSSIVWMAPVFVMNLIRAWSKRYFGANFKEDFHTVKNAVKNLFGFHTGYPDLVRRIKYPAPDDSLLYPAALPIEKTFKETVREAQAADFHYLYEVTPLWSNHVRKSTCTDRMRCGRMKVKLNSLVDIQTSRNLVLEGLSDLHYEYDGLLGICIRKLDCNGKLIDYWFIPSQMIKHDMFTSQYRHYIVDYELANRLSVADAPKTKAREVDLPFDLAGDGVGRGDDDVDAQLEDRHATREDMFYGLIRFATGLGKKILIADHCFSVASQMLDGPLQTATTAGTWLGILMFTFQIYFDFSGYSDMAIGLGRIFGFKYMENFNLPYTARSITDFWRRWHISLSTFFRDYVYIPLGGNRRHRWLNLLVVWSLTGLWHGASWNFLLWGLYFFVLLVAEKPLLRYLKRWPLLLRQLLTMFFVVIGWTIFYFTDFARLGQALAAMFGFAGGGFLNEQVRILLMNNLPLLLLCILGASALPRALGNYFGVLCAHQPGSSQGRQWVYVAVSYVFCVGVIVLSTISLVGSGFSAFLYYRF